MKRTMIVLLLAAVLGGCAMPILPDPPPTPSTNGEHWIFGASISWQTAGYSQNDGRIWDLNPAQGLENIRPKVLNTLANRPDHVILADIGINSAGTWDGRDGWSYDDEWYWWDTLMHVQGGTCVTLVLPHLTADAELANPGVLAHIEAARAWMHRAKAETPWINMNIVDWREYAGDSIGPDGIHVLGGEAPAMAWISMLNAAMDAC